VCDMDNVSRVVEMGTCTSCGACAVCKHISFQTGKMGFPVPAVDENCIHCGRCLALCDWEPLKEEEN